MKEKKRNNYGIIKLSLTNLGQSKEFAIDEETSTLRNVSILSKGEARGHFFHVDDVMLQQCVDAINTTNGGTRNRMTHPELESWSGEDIDVLVGRTTNAQIVDGVVRADIKLSDYADKSPRGELKSYLMAVAKEDPTIIGMSIVFEPDEFDDTNKKENMPAGRLRSLIAIDFVGTPAANASGLLSQVINNNHSLKEIKSMNELVKAFLVTLGLPKDASDEDAQTFFNGLKGSEKEIAQRLSDNPVKTEPKQTKTEPEPKPEVDKALAERKRVLAIRKIAKDAGLDDAWTDERINGNITVEQTAQDALAEIAKKNRPATLRVGDDLNKATLTDAITDALLLRSGSKLMEVDKVSGRAIRNDSGYLVERKPHDRALKFRHLSLVELGRTWLRNIGVPDVEYLAATEVAEVMLSKNRFINRFGYEMLAQSSSDFPFILENVMNKTLRAAYEEAPKTWSTWARQTFAADFKTIKRVALSESPDLTRRYEGGEVVYATMAESRETYALVEYAGGIKLTRVAIINDDLDAFSRIPRLQANAAARKEDDVCYSIITTNGNMADTNALFSSAHSNLTATAGAPTASNLDVGRSAMRTQTGPNGALLNIIPRYLIVPAALEGTARALLTSEYLPDATYGHSANIWRGQLTLVVEPRLDAHKTVAWYLAADYNQIDTIEVCFLESEPVPQLKQETVFDTGDVKFAVTHVVAAKAIDWRGLYKKAGE